MIISFDNQWQQLWHLDAHWWYITPFKVELEVDCQAWGGWWQLDIYVLGFGVSVSHTYKELPR